MSAVDLIVFTVVSLPLMGIGNRMLSPATGRAAGLITPHGDREPDSPSRIRPTDPNSLPLMGIGN